MAHIENNLKKDLFLYRDAIAKEFPIEKIFLFGSALSGLKTVNSDIDVGIVLKNTDNLNFVKSGIRINLLKKDINLSFEPFIITFEDYKYPHNDSILEEILKTGVAIEDL